MAGRRDVDPRERLKETIRALERGDFSAPAKPEALQADQVRRTRRGCVSAWRTHVWGDVAAMLRRRVSAAASVPPAAVQAQHRGTRTRRKLHACVAIVSARLQPGVESAGASALREDARLHESLNSVRAAACPRVQSVPWSLAYQVAVQREAARVMLPASAPPRRRGPGRTKGHHAGPASLLTHRVQALDSTAQPGGQQLCSGTFRREGRRRPVRGQRWGASQDQQLTRRPLRVVPALPQCARCAPCCSHYAPLTCRRAAA